MSIKEYSVIQSSKRLKENKREEVWKQYCYNISHLCYFQIQNQDTVNFSVTPK